MSINQRLDLKQGQTLTMTPQLQQAIKLLQMSNIELTEFVEAELEKNPLLERDESMSSEKPDNGPEEKNENSESESSAEGDDSGSVEEAFGGDSGEGMAAQEGGYDAFATSSFGDVGKGGSLTFDDPDFGLESTLAKEKTLRDHLTEQINVEFEEPRDLAIAHVLMDYVDQSGYLRVELTPLAERLGTSIEKITDVLTVLQKLDPPGIFARDLKECLALQLREKDRLDPAMQKLLENLELLASHDMKKLKTICNVDEEDLKDMIGEIRELNPKPALNFDHFVAQTVIPDVLMKPLPKSKGGGWAVELNNDTLPRVLVNKRYYTEISQGAKSKQDKEYLSEQMNTANWLIKAMDQRAETILKTASEIILQQEPFFLYGVEFLRPLVLKDVAEVIGMHESTVSRVTTGKYIGTPRGVFEMKYFFTSGVGAMEGDGAFSSEAVKARIKSLIDTEAAKEILSDDDLVTILKKEGIDIARRTVAKYRESLGIASSVQRRRQKGG